MGYFRVLLHRKDRTDPPFQDGLAADQVGRRAADPRIAVHCRSPTSLVTPSKGCACLALGGAPSRHMTVVASEVSWLGGHRHGLRRVVALWRRGGWRCALRWLAAGRRNSYCKCRRFGWSEHAWLFS
eukprot:COSAG01_NODE_3318_length_6272_cov_2.193261_12_plen_127_part_00